MNIYKTDFGFNSYISKCDLINKYNFLNTNNLLKVSNICLTFNFNSVKDIDLSKKTNTFVYLFSMFGAFPFLTINNTKTMNLQENLTNYDNFSLNLLFDKPNEINSFFFSFFIENWSSISIEDILFSKANLNHNLCLILSTRFFFGSTLNWISDLDFLNFKTKIKFEPEYLYPVNFNLLKNFPLFWISG
jgi:hypothetical protein